VTHYVIIGDGSAGTTAAYYIRQADPAARIEIYSDDPNVAYYRAALTNYLMGELLEAQLFATPPDFYQTNNIQRSIGRVVSLDSGRSRFTLAEGSEVSYDQLLIAAGASPNPPGFTGSDLSGVMTMRTLQDARTVMDLVSAKRLRQAVIVGGGPLGIEWVQGLIHHHVRVTYLLRGDTLFEKALDRTASDLVISRLRAEGVDVRMNEEIDAALAGKDGRLRAIRLKNSGDEIECQLVGAAIGIHPNTGFLNGSGVDMATDEKQGTAKGVKVNESMQTNIPNVYAAGDVIHRTLGLWEPARLQGRVAGRNMAGGLEVFRQTVHYYATRLYDLDFAGTGEVTEKTGDQVLIDFPRGSGHVSYRKLIVRDGKLVGAIMLGHRKEQVRKYGMQYRNLIEKKIDVSQVSENLLDPSFDLASWIDSHEISDQIHSARRIREQPRAPSIADMLRTKHQLAVERSPATEETSGIANAVLLHAGTKVPLKQVTRIGRKPDNDLVLSDLDVSGQHAQIRWDDSSFVLEDVQSRNGTFLNGVRISSPSVLTNGALIKVGSSKIQFVMAIPSQNLRMTSAGLPEAVLPPAADVSDPIWGILQIGGREIPLRTLSPNIGRDSEKADVTLDDPTISFMHAQLVHQGTKTWLRDLGSRNGTFVNGTRIADSHELESGDVIKLGETSLVFRSDSAPVREITVPSSPTQPERVAAPVIERPLPPASLKLAVVIRSGSMAGSSFPLDRSPLTIGRDPTSHIFINDETASWRHAIFKQEDMSWFVKDLGSRNRTFLNDKPLEPDQLYPLQMNDRIRIGDTLMEVAAHAD